LNVYEPSTVTVLSAN